MLFHNLLTWVNECITEESIRLLPIYGKLNIYQTFFEPITLRQISLEKTNPCFNERLVCQIREEIWLRIAKELKVDCELVVH